MNEDRDFEAEFDEMLAKGLKPCDENYEPYHAPDDWVAELIADWKVRGKEIDRLRAEKKQFVEGALKVLGQGCEKHQKEMRLESLPEFVHKDNEMGCKRCMQEEIDRLRAVHESEMGVCEQHCEVVKALRARVKELEERNKEVPIFGTRDDEEDFA